MSTLIRSFAEGLGSLLDIAPPYRTNGFEAWMPKKSDTEAIRGDFERVGHYISDAMNRVDAELGDRDERAKQEER